MIETTNKTTTVETKTVDTSKYWILVYGKWVKNPYYISKPRETTTINAITSQYLMYTTYRSQTIYSYIIGVDQDPVKKGQFTFPGLAKFPGLTFNSHFSKLEVIGDYLSRDNKKHQMMTFFGSFSNASNSLFDGDFRFEVTDELLFLSYFSNSFKHRKQF